MHLIFPHEMASRCENARHQRHVFEREETPPEAVRKSVALAWSARLLRILLEKSVCAERVQLGKLHFRVQTL